MSMAPFIIDGMGRFLMTGLTPGEILAFVHDTLTWAMPLWEIYNANYGHDGIWA